MSVLREPFRARSWAEFCYALIGLPLGIVGFLGSASSLLLSGLLVVTFLGLPVMALALRVARAFGALHRMLARRLLGLAVESPLASVPHGPGVVARLGAALRDPAGWRAQAYLLLEFPVAVLAFAVAVVFRAGGALFVVAPLLTSPEQGSARADGSGFVPHTFVIHYGGLVFDSWPKILLLTLQGIVMVALAPWLLRPVVALQLTLVAWLLGPAPLTERVRELERRRADALDVAAAQLRRIERDLHDGAQAQLVAVVMKLGLAREKLHGDPPADVTKARTLVDAAHETARSAITELRDLVAGIHPPILDEGLPTALATLTARSGVPTECVVEGFGNAPGEVPLRPSPAIEAIAYFCAAELLTNVAKHSRARRATVRLTACDRRLRLRVDDDGVGGAGLHTGADTGADTGVRAVAGTGLAGLRDRVRTVDGTFSLRSPPGGPTIVIIDLPVHP